MTNTLEERVLLFNPEGLANKAALIGLICDTQLQEAQIPVDNLGILM